MPDQIEYRCRHSAWPPAPGGLISQSARPPLAQVGLQRRKAGYPLDDIVAHTLPREASLAAPVLQSR